MSKKTLINTLTTLTASAFLACLVTLPVAAEEAQNSAEVDQETTATAEVQDVQLGDESEMTEADLMRLLQIDQPAWQQSDTQQLQLGPRPSGHGNFPLNCSDFNTSYCTYTYPGSGCCCVAQNPPPGVLCGNICI